MNQVKQLVSDIASNNKTPIVLTVMSCVGVVATAYLAAKAAPKAKHILDSVRSQRLTENLPALDVVKLTWKTYLPAIGVGVATIATVVASNRVNDRNLAILTASATLATNTFKDYQQHILEEIGAEKESRVRDRIARDQLSQTTLPESELGFVYTDGNVLFFDSMSGRYFMHNIEKIREIENNFNRALLQQEPMALNELYDALGLEPIDIGRILGFNTEHMLDFHFSAQLTPEKKPAVVLGHISMPVPDYDK